MGNVSIEEGNKLIAEFNGSEKVFGKIADDQRKYHSSWDWLKPVIDKIVIIGVNPESDDIVNDKAGEVGSKHICVSIEVMWEAVVEFIKWYNTLNKL